MGAGDLPLVSVVMATYAGDELDHLEQGIESILGQSHSNIEFLISIDGPVSDATREYLDSVKERNGRVRLLPQPVNRGPACARNAGFREARGEYIAIFDADDVSAPNRLERQLAFLQETGADLAGSFMHYIDDDDKVIGKKDMAVTDEAIRRSAILVNPINNPTAFAKAAVFRDNPYDERFRRGQDFHLWVRLILKGYTLGNVPEYLHSLRTGSTFYSRRSRRVFWIVLRCRFMLLGIYPVYLRPFMAVLAVGISSMRLLPPSLLKPVYWVRNGLRASRRG